MGLAGLFVVFMVALTAQAEPPSVKLPGRPPDSREHWGAFLGKAAHLAIGLEYRVQHPTHQVFLDPDNLSTIVEEGELG
ncbi:MAG TPA: hypothetical protein VK458_08015, partial [Myxococcaceae bacterium]|nr:hypothetical protein [Myxococcaceae bacterium]